VSATPFSLVTLFCLSFVCCGRFFLAILLRFALGALHLIVVVIALVAVSPSWPQFAIHSFMAIRFPCCTQILDFSLSALNTCLHRHQQQLALGIEWEWE